MQTIIWRLTLKLVVISAALVLTTASGNAVPARTGLGETMTVRSVFVISPSKRVELILSYPAHVGRNFDEILRIVDALQLADKYRVATPANWRPGDDTVVLPFISDEEAEKLADEGGIRKVRSYLGYVRDPSLRTL